MPRRCQQKEKKKTIHLFLLSHWLKHTSTRDKHFNFGYSGKGDGFLTKINYQTAFQVCMQGAAAI